jgi:DNA-binding NarL/FixJ family response regulator
MLDSGMKQKDIADFFNASNGTISDIKKNRIK